MPECFQPCRLAFLIRDLGHGGAQRQLVTLARALAANGGFDLTVVHFYPGPFEQVLREAGVKTICVGKKHRWDLAGFFFRLLTTFRELRPDVIHGYLHESNLMALLLKPLCGFPKVIWGIRDSQTDAATWGKLGKLSFRLNCLLSGHADLIIANSRAGLAYYRAQGYPAENFEVVPNGIDIARFKPATSKAAGSTFTLIGRLHPMKDHATLLRATALVPEVQVQIIGDGAAAYLEELQSLARTLGITDRVTFQPARDDLASLYPTLDCVVSTSAYGEGFSNVLGEAMACGIPCIASDVGDSAWLVDDTSWIFPASDHVALTEKMRAFLALTAEQRSALGHKNRQRIEHNFTVEKMVAETARLCLAGLLHPSSVPLHPSKVLWLTTGLGTGGAEMMLTQLITGLKHQRHVVISLTSGGKYIEPLRATGAEVHTLDMPAGKPTPRALWRLFKLVRQTKPGVIMGWMYHGCLTAQLARLMYRAPVIWNIRQSLYDLSLEKRGSAFVIRTLAKLSRFPETITYTSQLSARQHEAIGYKRSKTRLIPNGFDLEKWTPRSAGFQPSRSMSIGRFGRHTAMKDYPTFLEAAAIIIKELPDAQFLLVGTGVDDTNSELTAHITRLGLTKNVQLLGERHDLPALTASLDLAVSSSAFGEGFPNVVGEAMACAVPVVATDIGDTAWVMGDTGRLVPAKDTAALAKACLEVLTMTPEQRAALGQEGRQRIADHFSLSSVLTQFDTLLSALNTKH
ncbi:MAG: glycosyltransferase [Prosthecobacter sp.]